MIDQDKKEYIEEEAFLVQNSGEIPEVTLQSSLHYLTEDPDGPGLELNGDDIIPLKQAVVERYRAIILRDLDPGNRDKRIYRGLARCRANWQRFRKFCAGENFDFTVIRAETAKALQYFLQQEVLNVEGGKRSSCINCSKEDIYSLSESLGLSSADLPQGWQEFCPGLDASA